MLSCASPREESSGVEKHSLFLNFLALLSQHRIKELSGVFPIPLNLIRKRWEDKAQDGDTLLPVCYLVSSQLHLSKHFGGSKV